MVAGKWSLLSYDYTQIEGGFTVVISTNTYCHLWLYWTVVQPWVHRKTRIFRGLGMPYAAYWCFQGWNKIEQTEPGDTLVHTFTWTGWHYCDVRYFCFHGTMSGIESKSDSPIFSLHYTGEAAMLGPYYKQILGNPWTWHLSRIVNGAPYLTTHDHPDANGVINSDVRHCYQEKFSATYYGVERIPLYFDTSVIPAEATIRGAVLVGAIYYAAGKCKETRLYNAPLLNSPPIASDYGYIRTLTANALSQLTIDDIVNSKFGSYTLNLKGLESINRTGITKWAIRTIEDVTSTPPLSQPEGIGMGTAPMRLIVCYYLPE